MPTSSLFSPGAFNTIGSSESYPYVIPLFGINVHYCQNLSKEELVITKKLHSTVLLDKKFSPSSLQGIHKNMLVPSHSDHRVSVFDFP